MIEVVDLNKEEAGRRHGRNYSCASAERRKPSAAWKGRFGSGGLGDGGLSRSANSPRLGNLSGHELSRVWGGARLGREIRRQDTCAAILACWWIGISSPYLCRKMTSPPANFRCHTSFVPGIRRARGRKAAATPQGEQLNLLE